MQGVAISWLIFRLTQSEVVLGLYGFAAELPGLVVVLLAGVLADRFNPRRILLITQTLAMLQAFLLGVLVHGNHIHVSAIFAVGCFLGFVNGFDVPARQVLLSRLVGNPSDTRSAVALYSLTLDAARIVGPALAGSVIAAWGESACFLINGLSYVVVICALLALRIRPPQNLPSKSAVLHSLWQGMRYVAHKRVLCAIILLVAWVSFAASSVVVTMPFMAANALNGGPLTLGLLWAATGIGAIVGATLFFGIRYEGSRLPQLMGGGAALYGLGIIGFSQSASLVLSVFALAAAGLGIMIMMGTGNTILLSDADEDKRGRVMSLFTLSFMGTVPLGSFGAGFLARSFGAPATLALAGSACLFGAAIFGMSVRRQ